MRCPVPEACLGAKQLAFTEREPVLQLLHQHNPSVMRLFQQAPSNSEKLPEQYGVKSFLAQLHSPNGLEASLLEGLDKQAVINRLQSQEEFLGSLASPWSDQEQKAFLNKKVCRRPSLSARIQWCLVRLLQLNGVSGSCRFQTATFTTKSLGWRPSISTSLHMTPCSTFSTQAQGMRCNSLPLRSSVRISGCTIGPVRCGLANLKCFSILEISCALANTLALAQKVQCAL